MKKKIFLILFLLSLLFFISYFNINTSIILIRYIGLYCLIIFNSIVLSLFLNKKLDQTIPLTFLMLFIYLYVFGLFNCLLIGIYTYIIFSLVGYIFILFKKYKEKNLNEIKDNINVPGFYIFTFLYFLFMITTRRAGFYVWDEFTFWGVASKSMYYSNSFYIIKPTSLFGVGYPPCPTIFQYFFAKIIGKYSQGIELFAIQMFSFSLILPFFKNIKNKNILKITTLFISILFALAIFCESNFYFTIYTDVLLGIMVAYIIFEYITEKNSIYKTIMLALGIFVLTSLKATGFVLAGLIILFIIIDQIISLKNDKKNIFERLKKINYKQILICIVAFTISFCSWKIFIHFFNEVDNNGYNGNILIENRGIKQMFVTIGQTFFGADSNINSTFSTFFDDFFDKAYYSTKPVGLTGSVWISIFILAYLFIYKFIISKNEKSKYKKYFALLAIFSIIYTLFIQVSYFLKFSETEAIYHASMQRYMGSMFVILLLLLIGFIFKFSKKKELFLIVPAILLVFTPIKVISDATLTSGVRNYKMTVALYQTSYFADMIKNKIPSDKRIFAIHQSNADSLLLQFRYFMVPYFVPMVDVFDDKEEYNYIKYHKAEELNDELYNNYDYIAILSSDDYFEKNFSCLFENEKIEEWSIYKIEKKKNKVVLKKVDLE